MTTTPDQARTVALFVGDLEPGQHPGRADVRRAVAAVLRRHSMRWCVDRMAAEFDADPKASAGRLTWALQVIRDCYGRQDPVPPTRCRATGRSAEEFPADPDPWSGRRAAPRCPFTASRYRRSES
jgi:hypothetical protein